MDTWRPRNSETGAGVQLLWDSKHKYLSDHHTSSLNMRSFHFIFSLLLSLSVQVALAAKHRTTCESSASYSRARAR